MAPKDPKLRQPGLGLPRAGVPKDTEQDGIEQIRSESDVPFSREADAVDRLRGATEDVPDEGIALDATPAPDVDLDGMAQAVMQEVGIEAIRAGADLTQPVFSAEIDERTPLGFEDMVQAGEESATRKSLEAIYGRDFPLLEQAPNEEAWYTWADGLWTRHTAGVESKLHLVERNRLFRRAVQWVSSQGMGPWREPPKPRDAARVVDNMIGPALDQRHQLVIEQRPGFRTRPATLDQADVKKAEAQQVALEYQWDQQQMGGPNGVSGEATYWAGTDAVTFLEVYWDADAGAWHEFATDGVNRPMGDIKTRVRRIEQVRVSANASAVTRPAYWIVRDTIPLAEAVLEYGDRISEDASRETTSTLLFGSTPSQRLGYSLPSPDELQREQEVVDRVHVYCEPNEYMPGGLEVLCVGQLAVYVGPLTCGVVPLVRWTDGTSDPAFFPAAIMDGWIDVQMRQNAIWSKWVEGLRKLAGVNLLAREGSIATETMVSGIMNILSVKGVTDIQQAVRELGGISIAADVREALDRNQKRFEDLSGWNDTSRGASADMSGRAILAIREQLERIFAPPIQAAAQAMTEWAEINIAYMRHYYDLPRMVSVQGTSRPDRAREVVSEDFDGVADVFIDAETLMPMPRALRLFLLKDLLAQQMISPEEYRRRLPFGFVQNLETPDTDHHARAKRVVEAIRQTGDPMALPLLWQDNEAIHQDAIERELILPDDTDPMVREAAHMRWMMLAQQSQMKMGMMAPMIAPPGGNDGGSGQGAPTDPGTQPMLGQSPPIAAGAMSLIGGASNANAEAESFDARTQQ